jgi:hypothetical protein
MHAHANNEFKSKNRVSSAPPGGDNPARDLTVQLDHHEYS